MTLAISGDNPNFTNAVLTTPTLNSPTISGTPAMGASVITSGTAVASTSGTSIDFTSIPSWAKRITVLFNIVSTSGTSPIIIQIGSGSVQTTGYSSAASSGTAGTYPTSGLAITNGGAATNIVSGGYAICLMGSNVYAGYGCTTQNLTTNVPHVCAGSVTASGAIDRVRVTTVGGTDTFDAGSINILYE